MFKHRLRQLTLSALLACGLSPVHALVPFTGLVTPPYSGPAPTIRVGVGAADATGFLGASAGQYADTSQGGGGAGSVFPNKRDPQLYSTTKLGTYGVQTRLSTRALVIEGPAGRGSGSKRVVLLKTDNYLAQDLFQRRVAQILATGSSGITYAQILHSASHNHSSPYQLTKSAGVWVFQDRYSAIAFEGAARAAADAIEAAVANLKPARMGAMRLPHDIVKANIMGPTTASQTTTAGTPAGYPVDYGDNAITVLRFDDLTNPAAPKPLAVWLNHGEHPESLDGYHLISGDFVTPLERFVDRDTGAMLLFAQGDVGSAEGPYAGRSNTPNVVLNEVGYEGVLREWAHNGYAQTERAARILADATLEAMNRIATDASVQVPYTANFPVDQFDYWVAGPVSHPRPTIGNCNSNPSDPSIPVAPDCASSGDNGGPTLPVTPPQPPLALAPAFVGNQGHPAVFENQRIHLQAMRLGEVLLASCACEAQVDLILNLETRADDVADNIYDGFDWACYLPDFANDPAYTAACARQRDFYNPATPPQVPGSNFTPAAINRMRAQVHNNAAGWDNPQNAAAAESAEPADARQIWGNFTKEELTPTTGYKLPIGLGHAGDYNGYVVSYREYVSRDHYRKALTAYGPHTADYMVTRLVRMGRAMKDSSYTVPAEPNAAQADADEQRMQAEAISAGQEAEQMFNQRLANQPPDPGSPAILTPPTGVKRYRAATMRWRGGSNAVDQPVVTVERMVNGAWTFFADQSGEVQSRLEFPTPQTLTQAQAGQFEWVWTANFEAFMPFPARMNNGTPNGQYRFVVQGQRLVGPAVPPQAYRLESPAFDILPWDEIAVTDFAFAAGGVSFNIPAYQYPITYPSPNSFHVLADDNRRPNCKTCTFRPWASTGTPQTATLTVTRADGSTKTVSASKQAGNTWFAAVTLRSGDRISLPRGGVVDNNGEINGSELSLTVPVTGLPPIAVLTVTPERGLAPVTVTLDASGSSDDDAGDAVVFYEFDPGDGSAVVATMANRISHTYQNPGRYTARLKVFDRGNAPSVNASAQSIYAIAIPVAAIRGGNANVAPGEPASFDASNSSDANDEALTYEWNAGDGRPVVQQTEPTFAPRYNAPGSYTVTLTVINESGVRSSPMTSRVTVFGSMVRTPEQNPSTTVTTEPNRRGRFGGGRMGGGPWVLELVCLAIRRRHFRFVRW